MAPVALEASYEKLFPNTFDEHVVLKTRTTPTSFHRGTPRVVIHLVFHLAGKILRLRAEILGHFPTASGKVQNGGGSHMRRFGIVGVVEACGRRRSALHVTAGGTVAGGRGLWKRFGCKKGVTQGGVMYEGCQRITCQYINPV